METRTRDSMLQKVFLRVPCCTGRSSHCCSGGTLHG